MENEASMDTRPLTAHVPRQLAEQVDKLAAKLERSKGWIIKQALMAWLEQEEEKRKWTLEALEDVKKGRVLGHKDMVAWAKRLPGPK
jgi:predicted transcriptional regulator